MQLNFSVYRYNPDVDDAPRMQDYQLEVEEGQDMMVLDALIALKETILLCHFVVHAVKVCVALTA